MLDIKTLRNDLDGIARNLARRGFVFDREEFLALEAKRKALQVEVENFRAERNARSKAIGEAKAAGEDIAPLTKEVGELGRRLSQADDGAVARTVAPKAQPVQRARVLRAGPSPAQEQGNDQRLTPRSDAASCGVTLAALQRAC